MCIRLSMLWNELLAHLGMDTFRVSYCGRSLYVVRSSVQMFVHNCFWQSKNFFSEPRPNLMHFHRKPHDPLWNTTKRCDSATTIQQPTKWFAFKIFSSETTGSRSIQLDVKLCLMTTKYNKRKKLIYHNNNNNTMADFLLYDRKYLWNIRFVCMLLKQQYTYFLQNK